MKHIFFSVLAALALVSCSEISTDPAPTRLTRTVQTATITYRLTSAELPTDTVLINPKLEVYTYQITNNADGSTSAPNSTGTLLTTITGASLLAPQPIVLINSPVTVVDGVPSALGVRLVLTSTNRPGRRSGAQRLTSSLIVNGVSRLTTTLQGTSFARNATPTNGVFTATSTTNIGGYSF